MRYQELIDKARLRLFDTQEPYLWSGEELLDCLVESLHYLMSETKLMRASITESLTAGQTPIPLASGQLLAPTDVSFEGEVIMLSDVFFDGEELMLYPKEDLFNFNTPGTPHWYFVRNRKLYLRPIQDTNGDLTYEGVYVITNVLDRFAEILIPPMYHLYLLPGIMEKAYMKTDSETFRPQESMDMGKQFRFRVESIKKDIMRSEKVGRQTPIARGLL
jgi:hypothetical protein